MSAPHATTPVRRVALLRHASAANTSPSGRDIDRPLTPHGQEEAEAVAAWLAREGWTGLIVASPARRTLDTALAVASALGRPASAVRVDARVFDAHEGDLVAVLRGHADDLLVVGHNPAISELAQHLTGDERIRARGMTKAGLVVARVAGEAVRANVADYTYVTPDDLGRGLGV